MRDGDLEFLLVRTRSRGRWTFPKGSAEPGLTHAQAAALEAFEEAGVHGRIEEASFARYHRRPYDRKSAARSGQKGITVSAHLCEVLRLGAAQESGRNRTWFTAEEARQRLREGRASKDAAEFVRVVDKAVKRIQRLPADINRTRLHQDRSRPDSPQTDALQKVQVDFADAYGREYSFVPSARQVAGIRRFAAPTADIRAHQVLQAEVLQFSLPREKKPNILGTGKKNR